MGQVVRVIERPSSRSGIVRYETNRVLTGMGHERYINRDNAVADTPSDELARRLFDRGGVQSLHINSNVITVALSSANSDGIREIIEDLYTYWRPGMEPLSDEELIAAVEE